ncbi:hypothetical protein PIROE2DRAFT_11787 [Piromyces sp. E2]|nr:hypothetical protein PIROE2DRAFT_11787 [Piromyces sp. E2]|eukprot:OUM62026.1 hypothetical protein PIROE2DRAFT_11787 [Piromyces sp. E2]
MDEIFRVKLHNVKLDSTPSSSTIDKINNYNSHLQGNNNTETFDLGSNSTNNLLSSFLDIESIQKLFKKNNNNNRTNDDMANTKQQENVKDQLNIDDSSPKQLSNSDISLLNNSKNNTKNNKKRQLCETDILEINNSTKELINIFRESEEKQIQKQHNLDMRVLRERELDLEESKQKIEREKLELEKVQINLQIKLYEEKLINNYHNNDISRGLNSINSTLATLNNLNSLSSVQVLQNSNNLKLDNQKK